ncbi:MAG: MBL fold metallo-hydrolase [Candidatus Omnitrophica bacterium]|nr:MBL fold metallo-hydrolase [Candidatus Omnitrophota bacterium]
MNSSIQFLGGLENVTGSMHVVEANGQKILLDCGLYQGRRNESYEVNRHFPFEAESLDAMVLSHAHIDHSGNIPNLIRSGFHQPIYATEATKDLCTHMLLDSAHIQEEDIRFVNKIHRRKGFPPRHPLYTTKDAQHSLKRFFERSYEKPFLVVEGATCVLYDAGHVLGSAIAVLEIAAKPKSIRIAYAVDLGRASLPILRDPVIPERLDYLIIESTYGGRLHDDIQKAKVELKTVVEKTIQKKGKLIVPTFALERTQEVVYYLNELIREKSLPPIPIYVDSPLASNLTEVFRNHPECWDDKTRNMLKEGKDPFGAEGIEYIRDVEESKKLNERSGPMVILSASGMCESGRILHHLKNSVEDPKNTILVVGFMAKETLGRRIVEREKSVKIFGEPHLLRAEVSILNAFSGHADQKELLNFITQCGKTLKQIFIVHGERSQGETLQEALREQGIPHSLIPERGQKVRL